MNKALEGLLLTACKILDLGVVGADAKRAHAHGVPIGALVQEGNVIPGSSRKAIVSGYYCPYSVWRPPSGRCLMIADEGFAGSGPARYHLVLLEELGTYHSSFGGRHDLQTLTEIKAYLRGIADGAHEANELTRKSRR